MLTVNQQRAVEQCVRRGLVNAGVVVAGPQDSMTASIMNELDRAAGPMRWSIGDQVADNSGTVWVRVAITSGGQWTRAAAVGASAGWASDESVDGWLSHGIARILTSKGRPT